MNSGFPGTSGFSLYAFLTAAIVLACVTTACHQNPKTEIVRVAIPTNDSIKVRYAKEMVDNKKDPSCGMPLSAGIEDTVHYNGKVYGFCSKECKDIFLKDPKTLAKNAEMK
jgi:YHS domain-containing protein